MISNRINSTASEVSAMLSSDHVSVEDVILSNPMEDEAVCESVCSVLVMALLLQSSHSFVSAGNVPPRNLGRSGQLGAR